jgi:L-seryl-tRNA(Ser) seleniumtransferase
MVLSAAACIAGTDPEKRAMLPFSDGLNNEIVVQRSTKVGYAFAIRQAGGKMVEFGTEQGATVADLEAAITPRSATIFVFYQTVRDSGQWDLQDINSPASSTPSLPLEQQIAVAKKHGIPLVVDAAAQLPPVENLWQLTAMGADLVLFSGGKGLCGPQSSGLILGRQDLIDACAFNACPRGFIGRPMKVGKEEIIGLMTAVRLYIEQDHEELLLSYEERVARMVKELDGHAGISARRSFPSEAGQPHPRAEIILDVAVLGIPRDELLRQLYAGSPVIHLAPAGVSGIYVNPQTLQEGEEQVIVERMKEIITPSPAPSRSWRGNSPASRSA